MLSFAMIFLSNLTRCPGVAGLHSLHLLEDWGGEALLLSLSAAGFRVGKPYHRRIRRKMTDLKGSANRALWSASVLHPFFAAAILHYNSCSMVGSEKSYAYRWKS